MKIIPERPAMGPGLIKNFSVEGGTAPYIFSVLEGGGSINPANGAYTSPANVPAIEHLPIIGVTDADGETAELEILVGNPIDLVCDIIQREMELQDGRVRFYNQKLPKPDDRGLSIAVSVGPVKPFARSHRFNPATNAEEALLLVVATVYIDVMSVDSEAFDRKEEVIMALGSVYSLQQQSANGFNIARLPTSFTAVSELDGSAIPYRFSTAVNVRYGARKTKGGAPYAENPSPSNLLINS